MHVRIPGRPLAIAAAALLGTALTPLTALAQDATWKGPGNFYGDPSNWLPAVTPTGTATFSNTGPTSVEINVNATINRLLFNGSAPSYSITNEQTFTINGVAGVGISNQSAKIQAITNINSLTLNSVSVLGGPGLNLSNNGVPGGPSILTLNGASLLDPHVTLAVTGGNVSATGAVVVGTSATTNFNATSGADSATINQSGGLAVASGTGADATGIGGVAAMTFNDTTHADGAKFTSIGGDGVAVAGTNGATAIGGVSTIGFKGGSHADGALFKTYDGGDTAVAGLDGKSATALSGVASVTFENTSHADNAEFDNTGYGAVALGGSGRAGTPTSTGTGGGLAIGIGGGVNLILRDDAHANGATIKNLSGGSTAVGGTGGAGATGAGGVGGVAQGISGSISLSIGNNAHVDNGTVDSSVGLAFAVGGTGGVGGATGAGGAGGQSLAIGGTVTTQVNGNVSVSGTDFTNVAGKGLAVGGTGGSGNGLAGAAGAGGDAQAIGGSVSLVFAGNVALNAGNTISNTAGDVEATGGAGGDGSTGNAGARGGNATATGGDATVRFEDNASAGASTITNTGGAAKVTGGAGGDGNGFAGGGGGFASGTAGLALVEFTDTSSAGSASIQNNAGQDPILNAGTQGATGSSGFGGAGGTGGGGSFSYVRPEIRFSDSSTGGSAHVVNQGGLISLQNSSVFGSAVGGGAQISNGTGSVMFTDSASLGNGKIINGNGVDYAAVGFADTATAGTGTITNNNQGSVSFATSSTMGSSTLTNNSGGNVYFNGSADAVAGSIVNSAGATVNVGVNALRLGSLSGAGTVQIFSTSMQVGYLDRNETFSGVISGAGQLVKRGTGTLTLSGASTYSGGTSITAGTIQLDNLGGAGTGTISLAGGNLRTNASGTLTDAVRFQPGSTGAFSAAAGTTLNLTGVLSFFADAGVTPSYPKLLFGTATDTGTIVVNSSGGSFTLAGGATAANVTLEVQGGTLREGSANGSNVLSFFTSNVGTTQIDAGGTLDFNGETGTITTLQGAGILTNSVDTTVRAGNFGGSITGAGGLVKTNGSTVLILTGSNTYSGTTTISAGLVQIGVGGTTGTLGTGAVVDNASLTFNRSDSFSVGNAISGTGTLTKLGAGTLSLTGTNTYSGLTTVSAGTLQIGNGGTTGSITGDVANSANLAFNRSDALTYGGMVSGTGSLTKLGAGTLTLTGANTYTGGTTLSAGALQIGNGGTTGSIVGDVVDNANLTFNRSDTITYGGVVSGSGSLTKAGAGILALTGTNAYTGGTTISAGTLQIGNGGTTGSIVGDVVDNANLAFNRSDTVTFGNVVSGSGSLTKAGAGTLILTNANTFTGGTTVSAGTLQIGNGGTTGSIAGNVVDNANLIFNRSDTVTFGGVISGTGSLTKAGAGTLVLTAANTYTGATTVATGTLQVSGSTASNTTVNAGATLTGTGTIGGTLTVNGTVIPGSSATPLGTLTVTGNTTFNAGSVLLSTINTASTASSLLQAGSLTLNGGQVRPQLTGTGLFPIEAVYRVATGTGGRTGSFTGVDEALLPTYLDGALIYTATDVTLRIRRNATTFGVTSGLTPNQAATGAALDAAMAANNPLVFSTYLALYNTLLSGGAAGTLASQLETLSGDSLTAYPLVEQRAAQRFADRLALYTWSNSSNLWGLAVYGDQKVSTDSNGPAFHANGAEFQLGYSTSLTENTRLGVSGGYSNLDVNGAGLAGGLNTWDLGLHLRQDFGGFYASGQGTYSWHSADSVRTLLTGTAAASFDASTWTLAGEIGGVFALGRVNAEPFVSVRHAETSQDAYSETGPVGALNVAAEDLQTTRYGAGIRVANRNPADNAHVTALVRYERESGDDSAVLDNGLPGLPIYRVRSARLGEDIFSADMALEFNITQALRLVGGVRGSWRSHETLTDISAGLRVRF